jgi:hypothetical protein
MSNFFVIFHMFTTKYYQCFVFAIVPVLFFARSLLPFFFARRETRDVEGCDAYFCDKHKLELIF